MDLPLVSIIIPVYNNEDYIRDCLDSIMSQTYSNLEVIVLDDGSTDSSGVICDSYAVQDSRFIVVHQDNSGVSAARNYGVHISTGKWITFVDSDDYIEPHLIEVMVKAVKEYSAYIAIGEEILTAQSRSVFLFPDQNDTSPMCEICECHTILKRILNNNMRKSIWAMLFYGDIIRKSLFPEGKIYEDLPYLPLVMKERPNVVWIHKKVYAYRQNPESITHQAINKRSKERIEMKGLQIDRIERFFPELDGLAIGSLYADCLIWWLKADAAENKEAGLELKKEIEICLEKHPLSKRVLLDRKLSFGRRMSLLAAMINFRLACVIKKYLIWFINH